MADWQQEVLEALAGKYGRIAASAGQTATGRFIAVVPKVSGGTVTYGAGCEAMDGQAPADGDVPSLSPDVWPAKTVVLAANSDPAWLYLADDKASDVASVS